MTRLVLILLATSLMPVAASACGPLVPWARAERHMGELEYAVRVSIEEGKLTPLEQSFVRVAVMLGNAATAELKALDDPPKETIERVFATAIWAEQVFQRLADNDLRVPPKEDPLDVEVEAF